MCVLIGTTVKTKFADYPCATREEAEALFMQVKRREEESEQRNQERQRDPGDSIRRAAKHGEDHATE